MQNEDPQTLQSVMKQLAGQVQRWGRELGFQEVGITDTRLPVAENELMQWLGKGYHGTMDYMAKHGSKRCRPDELVPGTLRVITVRMNYLPQARDAWQVIGDGERAYVSRYALGRDYHKVLRNRLEKLAGKLREAVPAAQCRVFTDSAPVMEVALAEKSRLGWRGKHTLLLTREHGSWFFLGEIYTDVPLHVEDAVTDLSSHCGTCTACLTACPTQAIVSPYEVDARRCISYLTIELKGSIPVDLRPLIGNRIYGCDDCQLVCPWNRFAQISDEADFAVRNGLDDVSLLELFAWDEDTFNARMAGSAIYRIGYEQWQRNIAVALGNAHPSAEIRRALQEKLQGPSVIVSEHAEWALRQYSD